MRILKRLKDFKQLKTQVKNTNKSISQAGLPISDLLRPKGLALAKVLLNFCRSIFARLNKIAF